MMHANEGDRDGGSPLKGIARGDGAPSSSFRQVTQRTARWATNLLASGLVIMIGLVMGRQMLDAWYDSPTAAGLSSQDFAFNSTPDRDREENWLEFGGSASRFLRGEVQGGAQEALNHLRTQGRAAANDSTSSGRIAGEPLRNWIHSLQSQPPVERDPGNWLLYQIAHPLPMVMVLRDPLHASGPARTSGRGHEGELICWGIAFPADSLAVSESRAWTTFVGFPGPRPNGEPTGSALTLPEGCRRVMVVGGRDQEWVAFASTLEPGILIASWDAGLTRDGWRPDGVWRGGPAVWHRRYGRGAGQTLHIQFSQDSDGKISGFCVRTGSHS